MNAVGRILAVAGLRYREGARGPLLVFLLAFLGLATAACLLVPGEPGSERQRAVDRLVFDAALLVSALAAASLAAAPDPADRAAGRDAVLGAGPLRPAEGVLGAWLGHGACLVLLLAGMYVGSLAVTGLLTGGNADRPATRSPVFAVRLEGPEGAADTAVLAEVGRTATYVLPAFELAPGEPEVVVRLTLYSTPNSIDFPASFPVGVTVGAGETREITVRRNEPLRFRLGPEVARAGGEVPIRIERRGPSYGLGLSRDGLVAEGPGRTHAVNFAKALTAWLGGLMVLAASAAALGAFVQAPVAVAGTLAVALIGRSLGLLEETAGYLWTRPYFSHGLSPEELTSNLGADFLRFVVAIWPDLDAADLTEPVAAGWDIGAPLFTVRLPASLIGAGVFLAATGAVTAIRRRR